MRVFKEEQRFNQPWLIILVIISTLIPLGIVAKTYIEEPNNFNKMDTIWVIVTILFATSFLFIIKLTTRIDEQGIHYKFFPIHWKYRTILWKHIEKAYVKNYDPITDFGGWGLKGGSLWNRSKGQAINVSGDIGIQLELKNGKKLLLGTQKKMDAKNILAYYKSNFNH